MRARLLALALLTLALGAPAAASAAYAPKLTAKVTPSTFGAPVAITTTITQRAGETNSKKVEVQFPPEMGVNPDSAATGCTDAQEAARACPPSSLLGKASATVELVGGLTGTINLGEGGAKGIKIIVFLESKNVLVGKQPPIEGYITLGAAGPVTTFDNLKDLPLGLTLEAFTLSLDGPPNTLVANPGDCGTYPLKARFTSQKGATAASETSFAVTGCPPPNRPPRLTKPALVSGGKLRFTLSERADMTVRLLRGRKVVRTVERSARKGTNTFRGVIPPKLKKGRYTLTLRASDDEGALSEKLILSYRRR